MLTAEAKIRYASPALPATLEPKSDGMLLVRFHRPQWAVSPGQSAVFYLGDRVLGGGIIQQHPPSPLDSSQR